MSDDKTRVHIPLPKSTKAYICANCGAVSLDSQGVCKVQGMGTKSDWCGSKTYLKPQLCHNMRHNVRYSCANCGKVAVNPELLCEPVKMEMPEK